MPEYHLTKEMVERLQGAFPYDGSCDYTPEFYKKLDLPEEITPVFSLRSMTTKEKENSAKAKNDYTSSRKVIFDCITGWERVVSLPEGKQLEYNFENFLLLPNTVVLSLMEKIRIISGLCDVEDLALK